MHAIYRCFFIFRLSQSQSTYTIQLSVIKMLDFVAKSFLCNTFAVNLDKINIVMIKVSDTASKRIVDMMKDDGFDAAQDYVRVGVKSGGCSGLSYELKFDKESEVLGNVKVNYFPEIISANNFLALSSLILMLFSGSSICSAIS